MVQNISDVQSALLELSSTSSDDSCQKPLFTVLANAFDMASRGSVVTIFTDSASSDALGRDALDSLLAKAVQNDIQVEF